MKIKSDFITNSSSASFILFIETNLPNLKAFTKSWNKYIEFFIDDNKWVIDHQIEDRKKYLKESREEGLKLKEKINNNTATKEDKIMYDFFYKGSNFKDKSKKQLIKDILGDMVIDEVVAYTYEVSHHTSMYNYILDDVPRWMQHMIIMKNIEPETFSEIGFLNCKLKIESDH
jgi:hypothetical protein